MINIKNTLYRNRFGCVLVLVAEEQRLVSIEPPGAPWFYSRDRSIPSQIFVSKATKPPLASHNGGYIGAWACLVFQAYANLFILHRIKS